MQRGQLPVQGSQLRFAFREQRERSRKREILRGRGIVRIGDGGVGSLGRAQRRDCVLEIGDLFGESLELGCL